MKKSNHKIVQRGKLVLRREAIAVLSPAQLRDINAGGEFSDWWPCNSNKDPALDI